MKVKGLAHQFPVKVCGLTQWEDVELAAKLGAWALGFVLYQKSPRYVSVKELKDLLDRLRGEFQRPIKTVAVVVNESTSDLQKIVEVTGVDTIQLHGDESAARFQEISKALDVDFIKAFRPKTLADLDGFELFGAAEHYLIDAAVPNTYGGTGQTADWSLAKQLKTFRPLILSGGIHPANAVAAIRQVQPAALDLSSGLEEQPGYKSHAKLRDLFRQLEEHL